jgi:DNA (cytosine-5)-methyltransferase 1
MLTFGSLFSGIGGFDLGFERAGMECRWQCEIDKAASGVLAHHWPGIPNTGDVRNVGRDTVESVDLICGGFPCQDLSVAGKRAGLAGERSGLWFEFHRVLSELRPRWVVIENVPGLLSSNRGRDFAVVLRGLADIGYLSTWRVLDAQYFGVAQRRRRVFVVASLGNGRAAEVLFEREGGGWDSAPRREAGQSVAASVVSRIGKGGFTDPVNDNIIPAIAAPLTASGRGTERTGESRGQNTVIPVGIGGSDIGYTLRAGASHSGDKGDGGVNTNFAVTAYHDSGPGWWTDGMGTLRAEGENRPSRPSHTITGPMGVRRLTPTECERLQGFPDGWTAGQADSSRYRQLGNAVCVSVAEWIGRRILEAGHALPES